MNKTNSYIIHILKNQISDINNKLRDVKNNLKYIEKDLLDKEQKYDLFYKGIEEYIKLLSKDYSLHTKQQQKEYLESMFKHIFKIDEIIKNG